MILFKTKRRIMRKLENSKFKIINKTTLPKVKGGCNDKIPDDVYADHDTHPPRDGMVVVIVYPLP